MQQPGDIVKPQLDMAMAQQLLLELYGVTAKGMKEFVSYDDRNFYFKVDGEHPVENVNIDAVNSDGYVLKITNSGDSKDPDAFDAQNQMILHVGKARK